MPGSSRGRRGRSAVSTRDIEMRSAEEEIEFRRELERVIVHPTHSQILIILNIKVIQSNMKAVEKACTYSSSGRASPLWLQEVRNPAMPYQRL